MATEPTLGNHALVLPILDVCALCAPALAVIVAVPAPPLALPAVAAPSPILALCLQHFLAQFTFYSHKQASAIFSERPMGSLQRLIPEVASFMFVVVIHTCSRSCNNAQHVLCPHD